MNNIPRFARNAKFVAASIAAAAALFAQPAFAGLMVTDIYVTSGYTAADAASQGYIQLSEIIVSQTGTGLNVALNGNATGSGNYSQESNPGKAIDGVTIPLTYPNMYHSANSTNAFFNLSFISPVNIESVTLFGRDECCSFRDIYNVQFFGQNNTLLYTVNGASANNASHSVTVTVPEPAPIALFGIALAGFAASRRKSVKSKSA
jgi:hypothetical protein